NIKRMFANLKYIYFFFSSRRRHTRSKRDWSSDVCSSDLRGFRIIHSATGNLSEHTGQRFSALPAQHEKLPGFRAVVIRRPYRRRSEERRVGKESRSQWAP